MKNLSNYQGCLIGGAIGDALGYAVEFRSADHIFSTYGPKGITRYRLYNGVARISDDTQMTLFTADGLLVWQTRVQLENRDWTPQAGIRAAYLDWLETQYRPYPLTDGQSHVSWLLNCPELFSPRAPGNTCLSALRQGGTGTTEAPINSSKGCGGVMRVAPIGLFFSDGAALSPEEAVRVGAEAAAITHGHELGWLPSAALVHIVSLLASGQARDVASAVKDALDLLERVFPHALYMASFRALMEKALRLAGQDLEDVEAIHSIGGGWVGDEALAIAVYCAVKYQNDFEKCIIAAVNHSGDSDSTGAIAGNILGACLGMEAIPSFYLENLELKDVTLELAEDLWRGCPAPESGALPDPDWIRKYGSAR